MINKDAYYFSHDSNAKDDPKIMMLIEELGLEGYGIFWILIESLRDQPNYMYPLRLLPALARRYNTTSAKMETVVRSYALFQILDGEFFYSDSLNRRMSILDEKRKKRIESGRKGGLKTQSLKSAQKNGSIALSDPSSNAKASKVNKSKVNKNNNAQSDDLLVSTCYAFTDFWEAYGKKVDRKRCEKLYSKLTEEDRQKIKDTIDLYVATHKQKQYRKNPQTYLNGRNWEDDLTEEGVKNQKPNTPTEQIDFTY